MRLHYLLWVLSFTILLAAMAILPKQARPIIVELSGTSEKLSRITLQGRNTVRSSTAGINLWVDVVNGDNDNDGLSPSTAFRSIQRAANLALPGTTIHIQPGVYREAINPAYSGTESGIIRYMAEKGPGTVAIRGSDPSSSLNWIQLATNTIGLPTGVDPTNIYYTDLTSWVLSDTPRFVVELDGNGGIVSRLPLSREPDWTVINDWKYHEYWWAADGGSSDCNSTQDPLGCDVGSRSLTQLTDRHNDAIPLDIEQGNLSTLGSLIGAKLVVLDNSTGTFIFDRTIVAHDVAAGRITVNEICEDGYGSGDPALGWGSKYYVEGSPKLLDSPGEWWYDPINKRLYLWPRTAGNPGGMNIEISRRVDGFILKDRSYITIDGLRIEFFNRNAIYAQNESYDSSHHDTVINAMFRYDSNGIWLNQYVDNGAPSDRNIDGFTLENSEIAFIDNKAIYINYSWGSSSSAASFIRPGVLNTVIKHNELHHLGFRPDHSDGIGAMISYADHFSFEDNYVHDVAHNGIQIWRSVVRSTKRYNFLPSEIKTGDILIKNNLFERACQNALDCAAFKVSGTAPDRQVYRNFLVTGNIFRNTIGWTYIAEQRGIWGGGPASEVQGMGGFGMYIDNASGVHVYRNITYNNAFAGFKFTGAWRDGDIIFYNNSIANSLYGFHVGGRQYDTHDGSVNTQLVNNIIVNHEGYGIYLSDADGTFENTTIDHNLYFNDGWRPYNQGGFWIVGDIRLDVPGGDLYYVGLEDIQSESNWEDHGVEGNPAFWNYTIDDHDLFDGSWPDFHLTTSSINAIDRGTATLPNSLISLLENFHINDPHWGNEDDIGRYEAGFTIQASRPMLYMDPGGVVQSTLHLYPIDLPFSVTLQVSSDSPRVITSVDPTAITLDNASTLTIADTGGGPALPGYLVDLHASGVGGGFSNETIIRLLIGGVRVYLPMINHR